MSSDLNHLQQPDLFGLSTPETEGVCKAVDAMRDKDILPLTKEERIGITLAEDRIRDEHASAGMGFSSQRMHHEMIHCFNSPMNSPRHGARKWVRYLNGSKTA